MEIQSALPLEVCTVSLFPSCVRGHAFAYVQCVCRCMCVCLCVRVLEYMHAYSGVSAAAFAVIA